MGTAGAGKTAGGEKSIRHQRLVLFMQHIEYINRIAGALLRWQENAFNALNNREIHWLFSAFNYLKYLNAIKF